MYNDKLSGSVVNKKPANIINHIGLVLDASGSMWTISDALIKVADNQIKHLAQRSKEMKQETRISVWTFNYQRNIKCVVWDMDVLRLPSIAEFYRAEGQTALVDATLESIRDLGETPERHGDHSFLLYVLTDGEENDSRNSGSDLALRIKNLPDNWTLAALVPNKYGESEAKRFGFPAGNIEIWSTTAKGVAEVGERIRVATDTYMTNRVSGIRSTHSLFSTSADVLNKATVKAANLKPLAKTKYVLVPVPRDVPIREFTQECGFQYVVGSGYYQLMKTETIQANKNIAIVECKTAKVFIGAAARQMLGLPDTEVRVKPDFNPEFDVFVQSTSTNRKLIVGTRYLYLKA